MEQVKKHWLFPHLFFLSLLIPSMAIFKKRSFMLEGKRVYWTVGAMVFLPTGCVTLTGYSASLSLNSLVY